MQQRFQLLRQNIAGQGISLSILVWLSL